MKNCRPTASEAGFHEMTVNVVQVIVEHHTDSENGWKVGHICAFECENKF